jgi:hypothetical protein
MTFHDEGQSTVREGAAVVHGPATIHGEPLEPPQTGTPVRTVDVDRGVDVVAMRPRRDLIRWSAVWAGILVALGLYLSLQLALVASGIVELAELTREDAWWSAGAAVVGFLIGGIVAGASAMWRGFGQGLLHGLVLWSVGIVALLGLSALGGGLALGSFDTSDVFDEFAADAIDEAQANEDAEDAAGWALLGLGAALGAALIGGAIGVKMWPRREVDDRVELDREVTRQIDR